MTTTSLLRTVCHKDDSILLGSWLQETDHKFVEEQVCKTSSRVFCLSLKVIWCCWMNKNSNICIVIYMCTVYLLVAFKNLIFFFFYSSFKPIVHQGLDLLNMIHHVYLNAALRYTCQTADIFYVICKILSADSVDFCHFCIFLVKNIVTRVQWIWSPSDVFVDLTTHNVQ